MSYLEAFILGLVQGISIFIPVSSTAHLVVTQNVMIAQGSSMPPHESPAMILFDLIVHFGTLVSIAVVFWKCAFSDSLSNRLQNNQSSNLISANWTIRCVQSKVLCRFLRFQGFWDQNDGEGQQNADERKVSCRA